MAGRRSTPGLFELLQEADLSQFYNELRNYKESEDAYNRVLSLDPSNAHVLNNFSYYLSN